MPSWKKVIVSGSDAVLSSVTASFLGNLTGTSSFAVTAATASTADNFYVRGNVGVGVFPGSLAKLDVAGNVNDTYIQVRSQDNTVTGTGEGSRIRFSTANETFLGHVGYIYRSAAQFGMHLSSTNSIYLETNGSTTAAVTVNTAGNVGIGTTSPAASLQIGNGTSNANNRSSVAILSSDGGNAVLNALSLVNSRTAANGNGTAINFHNANNYSPTGRIVSIQDSGTNASLRFSVYNSIDDGLVERITLLSNGNVGIGTTNPTLARLQILGNVSASAYTGSLFGTASFAVTASYTNLAACSDDIKVTNWDQPDPGQTFYYTQVLSLANNCQDLTTLDTFGLHYESTPNLHYLDTGLTVTGSIIATTGFTGNLTGTASFANNATSASYARTASYAANATNIYNTNGTLTGDRVVDLDGNNLTFSGLSGESTLFNLTNAGTFEITGNPVIRTTGSLQHSGSSYFVGGNVGIGVTNPVVKLQVNGTITSTGTLTAYTSVPSINIGHDGSTAFIAGTSGGGGNTSLSFSVGNNNEKMRITSAGNVGIGTNNPAAKLHVSGGIYLGVGNANIRYRSSTNWDYYLDNTNDDFRIYDSDTTYFLQAVYNGGTTNKYLSLLNTLTVRNNGNVGIGTTNPGYKLQVINTSGVASSFLAGAGGYSAIRFASAGTVTGSLTTFNGSVLIGHENAGGTGTEGQIEIASNNDIILGYGLGSFTGNVGIGTSTPTLARLQILGNVSASAYTGSLFGTASFAVTASYSNRAKLADSASYALVTYEDQPAQGSQYWPTIATTYGTQYTGLLSDSRLTYFTDNGTLYSPSFSGSFTGSITNATSASFAPNFANTNLTLNNSRTHNLDGNNLTFTANNDESVVFNHSSGGTFEINGSPTIQTTGQLLHSVSSATGNIGIGTQTTTARLHVSGTTGVLLRAQNGSTSVLMVSSSGCVGIGTTNAIGTLTVSGNGGQNLYAGTLRVVNTATTNAWGYIGLPDDATTQAAANNYYLIGRTANITNRVMSFHIPNASDYGGGSQPSFGYYSTGADLLFSIEASTGVAYHKGNVGIGNTTPALRLDIVDNGAKTAGIDEALIRIRSTDQYGASIHMSGSSNWRIISTGGGSTPGGGDLGFYSDNGSSYRMVIQGSDGNVGIGTTAPSAELEVIAGATTTTKFNNNQTTFVSEFGSTGNSQYADILLRTNAGTGEIFKAGTGYTSYGGPKALNIYNEQAGIHFFPEGSGTARMSITGSNVGIGTTNPGGTFEVRGTNVIARLTSTATTNYTELHYQEGGTLKANIWSNGTAQSNYAGASSFNIANLQNAPMAFYTNGYANERMRITAAGNVGIGTTNPSTKLHLYEAGASDVIFRITPADGGYDPLIQLTGQGNSISSEGFEVWYANSVGDVHLSTTYPNDDAAIRFHTRTGASKSTINERLTITGGGNIGIGSTAPAQKLDVNGAIKASLSAVNQANIVMYNSSTGLLTYLATSSLSVVSSSYAVSSSFSTFAATANYANSAGSAGTATNADNAFVAATSDDQEYSLVLALPAHDEYEELKADSANASYNPSTGTLTAVRLVETSALKYKDNIESLGSTLDQVLKLRGVSFTKKNTGEQQIGFIADEIEKEFPQIVTKDNQGEIHGLSYQRMTAVLLESVKDLNSKIEAQNLFIKDLLDRIEKLENK